MSDATFTPKLPEIPEAELTPLVRALVQIIAEQQEQIQRLEDEIRRLKGGPGRPQLQPSRLEQATAPEAAQSKTPPRRGPKQRKTVRLQIHEIQPVAVAEVPAGSRFKGYRAYVVQDLVIRAHTTCYRLEQWQTATGEYLTAAAPVRGHYGPTLVSYCLHQYHHNHVTQPLLREQLRDFGIVISAGQLNRLLTEGHEALHEEKAALKAAGLAVSAYVQSDDTGARHRGQNGYCTYLGNERFAWFESTAHKSRVNFLQLLQTERCYRVNAEALGYMAERGLAQCHREVLAARGEVVFGTEADWRAHLRRCSVIGERAVVLATEGALVGGLIAQGFPADMGILSDDAGQFDVFAHGLCWVHAERPLRHLLPLTEAERRAIAWVRGQVWTLYAELKRYRAAPSAAHQAEIEAGFDAVCATETTCEPLNRVLQQFQRNKAELLRVLERPELPLHNNSSERDLRDYVKKRKISGSTRGELGRRCRDTFASLKKTCRKHGISFWEYLKDRVSGQNSMPSLAEVIRQSART